MVAAAREPLTRKQIAAVTGLNAEKELPPLFGRLAAFVPVREGRYALFHRSLFEWLTGWDTQQDQTFAGPYHLSLHEGHRLLVDWCWAEYQHGITKEHLYCLRHLPTYFAEDGRDGDLRTLLLDFNWLQKKLEATDTNALIADYNYIADDAELRLIQDALQLSAHVLARDTRQLAGQLIGRLLDNKTPSIQILLKQAAERKAWPWLRPLNRNLTAPGGPLIRTLEGHTGSVRVVVVTPDGRRALSGSEDQTLRLWNLETGQTLRTLEAHTRPVASMAVTPGGRRALSASHDQTLRLWDLESGKTICTLKGHADRVNAVAVTPDGRRALSASDDETLRLWDLSTGKKIRRLKGRMGRVSAVAVTPDGCRALSASEDQTLQLWDLESGKMLRTLEGHTKAVNAVAVTPDGRRALSASEDQTLRLWDLETGQTLRTLEGHTNGVNAVAVRPDGRHAVSVSFRPNAAALGPGERSNAAHARRSYGLGQCRGGNARRAPCPLGIE